MTIREYNWYIRYGDITPEGMRWHTPNIPLPLHEAEAILIEALRHAEFDVVELTKGLPVERDKQCYPR